MAAFNINNWKRIASGAAIGTGSSSVKSIYGYWSNETIATIEGAGYLNDLIDDLAKGDIVFVVADLDGTPTMRTYYVSSVTTNVALSRDTNQVTGDQNAVADLVLTAPTDAPATADALRDDLNANVLPPIVTKINAILAALRTAGLLTP